MKLSDLFVFNPITGPTWRYLLTLHKLLLTFPADILNLITNLVFAEKSFSH